MRITGIALGVLAAGMITGCATAAMDLQRASARAIVPTPNPDSVSVSDVHRGVLTGRWIATTPEGVYDCTIHADEKSPICAKRSSPK